MNILVTAIGSMSAESVIKSLQNLKRARVIGCNLYPASWTPASKLVCQFYQVSSGKEEDQYISELLEICKKESINYIIALTDPEIDALSKNFNSFSERGITLCMSSFEAISTARNKLAVYNKFKSNEKIKVIKTWDLQDISYKSNNIPLIAKPKEGRSSEGIYFITTLEALKFYKQHLSKQQYIVQPKINGSNVITVDVIRQPDGNKTVAIAREELLRTASGAGMTVRILPKHQCEELAIEIAHSIKLTGCFNIEFIIDEDTPLLMDINPRFSAGVVFSKMSGYDMASNHLNCYTTGVIENLHKQIKEQIFSRSYIEHEME